MPARRRFFRDLATLATPYFRSEDRWPALALGVLVIALTLGTVGAEVLFNAWYGKFYNSLEAKNEDDFWSSMWMFAWLAPVYVGAFLAQYTVSQTLQLRWRRWMTAAYLERWLAGRAYYHVELTRGADNPDQRIAEDVRKFVDYTVGQTLGVLGAVVTFISFVALLWNLGGPITLALAGGSATVPGYMVWVAIVYAVVGTALAHLVGRPLIALNYQKEKLEADFRFDLVRVRENAEAIALYRGERHERPALVARFGRVIDNLWRIIVARLRLNTYSLTYTQIAIIFPYIVAGPRFFAGAITLGVLMQITQAFGQVQKSLSYFVDNYREIAEWRAVMERLSGFEDAIAAAAATPAGPTVREHDGPDIAVEGLTLSLPDGGAALIEESALALRPAERALVMGPSGGGKSTLLRALAGIWPFGRGTVRVPKGARALFLPQKTYLPIASLREAVRYPDPATPADDAAIRDALAAVRLGHLAGRLDEVAHWARMLSPGEQQRLAVARALLYRPDWLFLDEATASVDEETERALYDTLRERLPDAAIVSVGHRSTLKAWHDRLITLGPGADGRGRLVETPA